MSEYNIAMRIGIGDIILCKSYLLDFDGVRIWLDGSLEGFRGPGYNGFALKLARLVYSDQQRFSVMGLKPISPTIGWDNLHAEFRSRQKEMNLVDQLALSPKGFDFDRYVCVHTKSRGYPFSCQAAARIVRHLGKMGLPVVMIGEKEIELNAEYRREGFRSVSSVSSVYSILRDIVTLDKTVGGLGITPPDMNKFLVDCSIVAGATMNICIGHGGNVVMIAALGKGVTVMGGYNTLREYDKIFSEAIQTMSAGKMRCVFSLDDLSGVIRELS